MLSGDRRRIAEYATSLQQQRLSLPLQIDVDLTLTGCCVIELGY